MTIRVDFGCRGWVDFNINSTNKKHVQVDIIWDLISDVNKIFCLLKTKTFISRRRLFMQR